MGDGRVDVGLEETWGALDVPAHLETVAVSETIRPDQGTMPSVSNLPVIEIAEIGDSTDVACDLEVNGKLGEGGMSVIARARQHSLKRDVAIKRVRSGDGTDAGRILLREARLTGSLEHPNIVPIHLLGTDSTGQPAIVMKRIDGVPWRHVIADPNHEFWSRHSGEQLRWHIETLLQVCNAIAYAHSRDIVHRDIKPDNVMIGDFGEVYVLDWGLALPLRDGVAAAGLAGTPAYMAPEMATEAPITRVTDVYLLGATLHEIITKQPPHRGKNMLDVLASVGAGESQGLLDDASDELAVICRRAMAATPAERYPSVDSLRAALGEYLQHRNSATLAEEGLSRLGSLSECARSLAQQNSEEQQREARSAFAECRFAFQQALRTWEGNGAAKRGLDQALRLMADVEIAGGNVPAAELLAEQLSESDAMLDERINELRQQQRAEADEVSQLRDESWERNTTYMARDRARALFSVAAVITVVMGALMVVHRFAGFAVTYSVGFGVSAVFVVLASGLLVLNRASKKNWINRRMGWSLLAIAVFPLLVRSAGWFAELPAIQTLPFELAGYVLASALAALLVDLLLFWVVGVLATAFIGTLVFPDLILELAAAGVVSGTCIMGWLWWGRDADQSGGDHSQVPTQRIS